MPQVNVVITLFKLVTNYKFWIVAEWNSRCRFGFVLEMVYWMRITISMIIEILLHSKLKINWCENKKIKTVINKIVNKLTTGK